MAKTNRRFYRDVSFASALADEFIPPSGTYYISQMGGNAGLSPLTSVAIIWDYGGTEEILFVTHGDAVHIVDIEFEADGSKKLAILLTNDQGTNDYLGGFWNGSD